MSTPKNEVVQIEYQNPDASALLLLPTLVVCNTTDELVEKNIRENSSKDLKWLASEKEHLGTAVLVGGGPSIEDHIDDIRDMQKSGATIFAMNAASQWCRQNDIEVDYQCIADAKEESSGLVDPHANHHIIGSQVHAKTMDAVNDPIVWHLGIANIESMLPEEKVKKGGYVILGGGAAVGNSSMCVAYAMGFRDLHVFGFDSCHKDGKSHAYTQMMNVVIPTMKTKWGGRKFTCSVAMKAQAEKFQFTAKHLKDAGCHINVYGDGLLQTMYNTDVSNLSEREKYQMMWQYDAYRDGSPGERQADSFLKYFKPDGLIIDFGCGTGRAGVKFSEAGHDVLLVDFADNCRDDEALSIPFIQWDLTVPLSSRSEYGYCTDVMEHIPPEDVEIVINNIMNTSEKVFFQISTVADNFGDVLDTHLHLTVKPFEWWRDLFISNGYKIEWEADQNHTALFYINNPDRRELCQ